ncbi:phospholipid phosphatase 1-like [Epargyreus clarus]|uniref:phospholipid phosphatase 1-like n=1 Tax=Epargyreus clarus TaxID=520877 RepID=UPI003C2BD744
MWRKLQLLWKKSNRWHRVIFIFLVVELRLVPGGQIGFRCNDPALSHPFTGDTVSWKWLIGISLLLPLAVMLLVERLQDKSEESKNQALFWYKEYFFGALLNLTLVQTLKLLVGSPRPHFFDTCKPKEALTCVGSEYVSSYTCTKAHWLNQSDKSFPSGHTSLALHAGLFIAYYLYRRTSNPTPRSAVACQGASVVAAVACALSRLVDHRHHWWDVLAGAAIAAPILVYTIKSLCADFECSCPQSAPKDPQIDPQSHTTNQEVVNT